MGSLSPSLVKRLRRVRSATFLVTMMTFGLIAQPAHAQLPSWNFGAPAHRAVAARVTNTSPNYQSPTIGTNISLQYPQAPGTQVMRIATDKGDLAIGFNEPCPRTAKTVVATGSTGAIPLTFCANQTDVPGMATITAQNLTTTMDNATATIAMAGRPATITATATRTLITARVTDAGGNNIADGTPVRYTIQQNAAECSTTTNGVSALPLSATAIFLLTGSGRVTVLAEWNETGGVATCQGAPAGGAG